MILLFEAIFSSLFRHVTLVTFKIILLYTGISLAFRSHDYKENKMKKLILAGAIIMLASTTLQASRIKIYGHRGAAGLSPENTLVAYRTGLAIGIDYVDMDVGLTKDGVVVVTHDFYLNPGLTRTKNGTFVPTNKKILIKDLTLKELKTYDVGELNKANAYSDNYPKQLAENNVHIPTLKQVIHYVNKTSHNSVKFQVEVKTNPAHPDWTAPPKEMAKAVVNVLKEEGIDTKTELQAFDWRVLLEAQKLDPKIATAYLTDKEISENMTSPLPEIAGLWSAGYLLKNYDNSIPKMIAALGGKIWGAQTSELTKQLVDEAHHYGLKVVPWTADKMSVIDRMINDGVDGIITNRPDIVRGLFAARDIPLPPTISM